MVSIRQQRYLRLKKIKTGTGTGESQLEGNVVITPRFYVAIYDLVVFNSDILQGVKSIGVATLTISGIEYIGIGTQLNSGYETRGGINTEIYQGNKLNGIFATIFQDDLNGISATVFHGNSLNCVGAYISVGNSYQP